jgi:hypothetical protein
MEAVNLDAMLARFAEHWSRADAETAVLLLEPPSSVVNTGDAGGELTAEVEDLAWLLRRLASTRPNCGTMGQGGAVRGYSPAGLAIGAVLWTYLRISAFATTHDASVCEIAAGGPYRTQWRCSWGRGRVRDGGPYRRCNRGRQRL